ncbi:MULTISPECIES: metal-dependent transcriptional regulator [Pseudobutyrivibrio]|jgi:Mn-dependent DtxR family transcriptional regulator|uniref:Iron (Metal) dependent repressor, DtxR family n=1 Tax=Pseudobutyrivibrio xylanivorans DSM 14809 TaxID=1123012 RepID=A0A1M6HU92_PSEXY|nr:MULTISPECIES: metal-dependent transcriptional regulator [Pseudobutyrivibrio]MDC7279497.1 metal-dependent transcriptional regulator [Butyrivibrio fibrisolvens]SHJ25707.1 iron (metal) dependent repressor, DtxR family [Pseudobutyrivibrio xylanivorans DSM 14809]
MNKASEDYIKNIYILKQDKAHLHSVDLAKELGLSRASVSRAMSNLRKDNIIVMKEDGEIEFTIKGQKIAEVIIDKYVTLTGFLQDVAGVDEETAKEDACKIEHYISDDTYAGIKQFIIAHPEL